jgi:Ser/Thr protein kinase RdoA (MazF antagonist)
MSLDDTFFALTPERVLEAVEMCGRRATGYALALNSLENRVYEVELEDGERLVAKFYRPGRWSKESLLEEHAFLAELLEAEVPVVAPLPFDDGSTLRVVAADEEGHAIYAALFPKVRGRASEELTDEQLERIGRLLARLHVVGERRTVEVRHTLTPDYYGRRSLEILERTDFIPGELRARFFAVANALLEACDPLFCDLPMVRVHGDCHHGNLLWDRTGPFFLDFDDFLMGPPVQDLWLLVPGRDEEAKAQRLIMVEAYESMRSFARPSLALIEPLRSLRIIRYAAWIAQRYADPAFPRAFPQFVAPGFWQREIVELSEQLERVKEAQGAKSW